MFLPISPLDGFAHVTSEFAPAYVPVTAVAVDSDGLTFLVIVHDDAGNHLGTTDAIDNPATARAVIAGADPDLTRAARKALAG